MQQTYKDLLAHILPDRLYELYGVTEGFITVLDRADAVRKAGSVGVPPPFYEMRIVDEADRDCRPARSARSSAAARSAWRVTPIGMH